MIIAGVDIGKAKHAVAAISESGELVMKPWFFNQDQQGFEKLFKSLERLGGADKVMVGMEATSRYWLPLRHALAERGYQVECVNPIITSHEIGGDVRGRKTDRTDAIAIATAILRKKHHAAPPEDADHDALKSLARHRSFIVRQRSNCKRCVHSALDVTFPEAEAAFGDLFSAGSLAVLERYPSARLLAHAHLKTLSSIIAKASRRKQTTERAKALREAARKSVSVGLISEGDEKALQSLIALLRFQCEQIQKIENQIDECPTPAIAVALGSIKGIGLRQSKRIAAEIGSLKRFHHTTSGKPPADMHKRILAFAGSEPRVKESGKWKGRTKISKRGSPELRTALWQAAATSRLHNPFLQQIYTKHIQRGKHHNVALFYVAKKIIEIMCGMYKSQTLFDPLKQTQNAC
jgi:transposase